MKNATVGLLSLVLGAAIAHAAESPTTTASTYKPPAAAAPMSERECAVWNRERSFARSVEQHDAKAFAEHLHPAAVFVSARPEATRGSEAVLKEWTPLIAGKEVALRWYPAAVRLAGDEKVALSHGPYWLEDLSPNAPQRFTIGSFISTWTEDAQGRWHVLYDGGGGGQGRPASAEDVARLIASLPKECPSAASRG